MLFYSWISRPSNRIVSSLKSWIRQSSEEPPYLQKVQLVHLGWMHIHARGFVLRLKKNQAIFAIHWPGPSDRRILALPVRQKDPLALPVRLGGLGIYDLAQ